MDNKKREAKYNPDADKRWIEQNREHRNYLTDRSKARNFIIKKASDEDLDELERLIAERRK